MQRIVTILGTCGAIGNEIVKELTARNGPIRLVSRHPSRFSVWLSHRSGSQALTTL
jgi:putative NADH-flavin reductase